MSFMHAFLLVFPTSQRTSMAAKSREKCQENVIKSWDKAYISTFFIATMNVFFLCWCYSRKQMTLYIFFSEIRLSTSSYKKKKTKLSQLLDTWHTFLSKQTNFLFFSYYFHTTDGPSLLIIITFMKTQLMLLSVRQIIF